MGKGPSVWDLGKGFRRWQLAGQGVSAVSFNQDTVFAINESQQLVMLERANGKQRRMIRDFPLVESVSVHGSTGDVHGRKDNGQQFIAAIGLQSGTTQWLRSIPAGAEVRISPAPTAASPLNWCPADRASLMTLSKLGFSWVLAIQMKSTWYPFRKEH